MTPKEAAHAAGLRFVKKRDADAILRNKAPLGKFFCQCGNKNIGIDNTSGEPVVLELTRDEESYRWIFEKEAQNETCTLP